MSYILDALKKLEDEKARKAAGSGMQGISGELFRGSRSVPGRSGFSFGKTAVVVVVASLATFGITWFFLMPTHNRGSKSSSNQVAAVKRAAEPAAVAPVAVAPINTPVEPIPSAVAKPEPVKPPAPPRVEKTVADAGSPARARQRSVKGSREKTVPAAASPAQGASTIETTDNAALITMQELRRRTQTRKEEMIPPPADIKLSGIAWQDERHARRAVVNGYLMQEGGVVSGARITEIRQDKVKFSQAGRVFEISLTSTGK